jgi:hypothetical protein
MYRCNSASGECAVNDLNAVDQASVDIFGGKVSVRDAKDVNG